jgi:hypothetical protein
MIVDLPAYVATDVAKTISYKIADGAISNSEVLNGIVALIASITKQIEQLQMIVAPKKTITCYKGKLVKKVTAVFPKCPVGYSTKK